MEAAIVPTKQDNADMGRHNKKKRSGPVQLFRIAMYALRFKSRKSKSAQVQAACALKNVVGSIRPLHYSSGQIEAGPDPEAKSPPSEQEIFESYTPPVKGTASSWASSSNASASRYASANDLLQLCRKESEVEDDEFDYDEDEEDKYFDGICGDEMIDSKADAFIAGFYEQMRLQRQA